MPKPGSKYIIEIEDIYVSSCNEPKPTHLYRVKGFNSLVFDEDGLKNLTSVEDYKLELLTEILGHFTKDK